MRIWNFDKSEAVLKFDHGSPVTSVAVRPDGKRIASAGENKAAKLWNPDNGNLIAELKGDGEAQQRALEAERSLAYAISQVNFRKSAIDKTDKERTAQVERVKKATEASVAAEKALSGKAKRTGRCQIRANGSRKVRG